MASDGNVIEDGTDFKGKRITQQQSRERHVIGDAYERSEIHDFRAMETR
jgi:hypothetical protein